jgi:hypothetical protein
MGIFVSSFTMIKIIIGFVIFSALALFILMQGGEIDMGGEKHGIEEHPPAKTEAHAPAAASTATPPAPVAPAAPAAATTPTTTEQPAAAPAAAPKQ